MNEQRAQAYLTLINALLTCSDGDEINNILQQHQDLIDQDLILIMQSVTQQLQEEGDENHAKFLISLANQLTTYLGKINENFNFKYLSPRSYYNFFSELLEKIRDTQANENIIYDYFKSNLDKLDQNLLRLLPDFFNNILSQIIKQNTLISEQKTLMALLMFFFGNLIQQFPLGNKRINMEISIACYENALLEWTREGFPEQWAMTQNNLGSAYLDRIDGEKRENLEKAIACLKQALLERTREGFPQQWAMTQNNLGTAYLDRISGKKRANLERAIKCFKNALLEWNKDDFPQLWATAQNNLGLAYNDRIAGEKRKNMEISIACHENALLERSRELFPQDWAQTQNNLGLAYRDRIDGEKRDNLEKTIACLKQALLERTRDHFPQDWAQTQNNLGLAYYDRIDGEKRENLERAIACYENALLEYGQERFPQEWAATQNNLANAYRGRISGEKRENLEKAIICYKNALKELTRESFPYEWARSKNNLGVAYKDRISGEKRENLEKAITCLKQALLEYTRDRFPQLWAATQNNLGLAYSSRISGEKRDNLEKAIACYENALSIRTINSFPLDCLQTAKNLGELHFKEGNWLLAINSYKLAIEAVELSRRIATDDQRRQEILADAISIYNNALQCYINLEQYQEAILLTERARSRHLVELMYSNDLYKDGNIPPEIQNYLNEYEGIQATINRLLQELQINNNQNPENKYHLTTKNLEEKELNLTELYRQKQEVWLKLRKADRVLAEQLEVKPPTFEDLKSLAKDKTAILSFYSTNDHTYIFVFRGVSVQLHTCQGQGYRELQNYIRNEWLIPYSDSAKFDQWMSNIPVILAEISQRLGINQLIEEKLQGIEELIIIPHIYLHLIPFSALPIPPTPLTKGGNEESKLPLPPTPLTKGGNEESNIYLKDKFKIRFAPSTQILHFCSERKKIDFDPKNGKNYGLVADATSDRFDALYGGDQIAKMLGIPIEQQLRGEHEAKIREYRKLTQQENLYSLHSLHHAASNLSESLESALLLADGKLTLGQLMSPGWRMPYLLEVFLSCCETNLGNPNINDDILTLAAGFLCAGARSVISTLWSVDARATALFCIFYYEFRQLGNDRPVALIKAQNKLANITASELYKYFDEQKKLCNRNKESAQTNNNDEEANKWTKIRRIIHQSQKQYNENDQETKPFENPYFWGGFVCHGLS